MSISTSIAAAQSSLSLIVVSTIPIPTSSLTATLNRTNGACSAIIAVGNFRNASDESDLRDPICSVNFKPEYHSIQSCCKEVAAVRIDGGCKQYCEVNNGTSGYRCIENLFEDYFSDDGEKPSARRQTLCTSNTENASNEQGKYELLFEVCGANGLIRCCRRSSERTLKHHRCYSYLVHVRSCVYTLISSLHTISNVHRFRVPPGSQFLSLHMSYNTLARKPVL